jgi:hypothetical protein
MPMRALVAAFYYFRVYLLGTVVDLILKSLVGVVPLELRREDN